LILLKRTFHDEKSITLGPIDTNRNDTNEQKDVNEFEGVDGNTETSDNAPHNSKSTLNGFYDQ